MATERLMLLPARDIDRVRLVRVPQDFGTHEAYRRAAALIASLQEQDPEVGWDTLGALLEEEGFVPVDFERGPPLD